MPGMVAALTHAIRATACGRRQGDRDRQIAQLLDRGVADQRHLGLPPQRGHDTIIAYEPESSLRGALELPENLCSAGQWQLDFECRASAIGRADLHAPSMGGDDRADDR